MSARSHSARGKGIARMFLGASGVLLVLMGVLTTLVIRQQQEHGEAVAEALFHEDVRTAMWRMETRVGAMVATTSFRQLDTAESTYSTIYSNSWIAVDNNQVNPLAPPPEELRQKLVGVADQAYIASCSVVPEATGAMGEKIALAKPNVPALQAPQTLAGRGNRRSLDEFSRRQVANEGLQQVFGSNVAQKTPDLTLGPLAPVWNGEGQLLELFLARRVQSPTGVSHESYRLAWPALKAELLAEVVDLFPTAELVPIVDPGAIRPMDPARTRPEGDDGFRLAAIPVRLAVEPLAAGVALPRGPLWTIVFAWTALLTALGFGWVALRASVAYGDKHRRFTHAVTHELRTPLTTFRMYSEMLSRGMVPEDARPEYLATLESESSRLSGLVENVLRYARLEEGSEGAPKDRVQASSLLDRCVPELARICVTHGTVLDVPDELGTEVEVLTDVGAVGQVLGNLVENACKYGCREGGGVSLRAALSDGSLRLSVEDEGPGVRAADREAVFEPFDRAGRDSSDTAPGVGLGLALSRDLARELGGDLTLDSTSQGARFTLRLPLA